jgi:Leucine-rich repeat (LRR) protein
MDSNRIKEVCEGIGDCDCLKELLLHSNEIETLPVSLQALTNLRLLTLSNNQFCTFPSVLESLVDINEVWLQNQKTGILLSVPYYYRATMKNLELLML